MKKIKGLALIMAMALYLMALPTAASAHGV